MTIQKYKVSEYATRVEIKAYIGDHTYTSHTIYEFKKNAIQELFDEVKAMAREIKKKNPKLVIGRGYTKKDIHSINFDLETMYKKDMEEFMNVVDHLPFMQGEQVTLEQMRAFNSVANHYGRHGSKSYLKYNHIIETYFRLEDIKRTLTHDGENLVRITI